MSRENRDSRFRVPTTGWSQEGQLDAAAIIDGHAAARPHGSIGQQAVQRRGLDGFDEVMVEAGLA